MKCSAIQHDDV